MASNTILVRGHGIRPSEPIANETITPGDLMEVVRSGGTAGKYQKHASAGGPVLPLFALELDYAGQDISHVYASGDRVHCIFPERGSKIYGWLASGQNVNQGTPLMSDGAGKLKDGSTNAKIASIVCFAAEAVNATAATTRINVEVL